MNTENKTVDEQAEVLLDQLLHLKQYERPDESSMIKSRQNIMRKVREANSHKRKSLGELLEMNMPWFFAEPRYGIALLFVAFAGLQMLDYNRVSQLNGQTGIYAPSGNLPAVAHQNVSAPTNNYYYPSLPAGSKLFQEQRGGDDVKFVGRLEVK